MEGEGHLLSNHVDIKATTNNTIEHFLYVKSFCDKQKICLDLVRQGQDVFAILPTGSGESLIFQLFPPIMNVIKGKVGVSISTIIIIAPLVARTKALTKTWQCGESVRSLIKILWKPRKPKNLVWKVLIFNPNKKIKALTEVKENQYLTASEIKSFQKQTAGKW